MCAASKFLSSAPNDLLLEIFIRLPDARSVIQCRSVCKRWSSILSDPKFNFIRRFNHFQHQIKAYHSDSAYTILFTPSYSTAIRACVVFSEKSKVLHGGSIRNYEINIFPNSLSILASFSDLLLLYGPPASTYCFYNPLTRQSVALPSLNSPAGRSQITGFFFDAPVGTFRVLRVDVISLCHEDKYRFHASVFCSKSGRWSESTFSCQRALAPDFEIWDSSFLADGNGILYCELSGGEEELEEEDEIKGFAAFDLRDIPVRQCQFLALPVDFAPGWRRCDEHVCSGVVQGRLRLSQLLKSEGKFVLKVWELNHLEAWHLVHSVKLERSNQTDRMFVSAFHPNYGDVIFIFCNFDLYQYEIGQDKYEKVGQFLDPKYQKSMAKGFFRKFPLVHPPWPTLIPTVPYV